MSEQEETIHTPTADTHEHAHDDHEGGHGLAGFEPENLNVFMIMGVVFATSIVVVVLIIVGFGITGSYAQQTQEAMSMEANYPEIRDIRAAATAELNKSGVVDAEAGVYRIPVGQAIDLMVEMQYKNPEGNFTDEMALTAQ